MEQTDAVALLGALAQDTRLTIFRELVKAHNRTDPAQSGLAVGALSDRLAKRHQVAPPTLSFHLKEMTNAGLIARNRQGRSIIYSANLGAMQGLVDYLLEDCCGGACEGASLIGQLNQLSQ